MKYLLPLGILLGLFAFGHPALADGEDNARRVERIFARLDTDNDGRISREEARHGHRIRRHFDEIDADKDGYITPAELRAFLDAHPRRDHHRS